jgi:putative sterol carrier protein
MPESASEFFESLPSRVDPAKAASLTATYRFDIVGEGSWRVAADGDSVTVEESEADADCVIQMSEATFAKLRDGRGSPMKAFMTGKLKVKGDTALALELKDLFF